MAIGKIIALTIQTSVSIVMSFIFNVLFLVFHSFSSKQQACYNLMAAVTISSDFGVQENKVCHSFHYSPSICHEVMEPDAMIFVF